MIVRLLCWFDFFFDKLTRRFLADFFSLVFFFIAKRPPVEETANFLQSLLANHGPNYLEKLFGKKARDALAPLGGSHKVAVALSGLIATQHCLCRSIINFFWYTFATCLYRKWNNRRFWQSTTSDAQWSRTPAKHSDCGGIRWPGLIKINGNTQLRADWFETISGQAGQHRIHGMIN